MPRATDAERAQRLNRAFELLARGASLNEAAEALTAHFRLSRRQAYRYLQEAQGLKQPVAVVHPTVAITIKVPGETIAELRAYAQASGLTMGEIVAHAVSAFLATARGHG